MKKVLVVAAHPDDELLGVGGTVAKNVAEGNEVYAFILGEGQTSRGMERATVSRRVVEELYGNTLESARIIGYEDVYFGNLPDNRFDQMDLLDVVKLVEQKINEIGPEIVYTHYSGDLNIDHEITARAVLTATRPMEKCPVKEIYAFETLSSTEWNFDCSSYKGFMPNTYVDISDFYDKKEEAMKCYVSELCEWPHPRSLEGLDSLSKYRGMTVGMNRAEAFMLIRKLV